MTTARVLSTITATVALAATLTAAAGDTRIATWKDDRTAVFLLMFDDSWPSHFQVAAPELVKRGMTGTFYINPGKGEYRTFAKEWEEKLWKQGLVYGNHTMTHKGAKDPDEARREVEQCQEAILAMVPGRKPRLVSFGMPGVKEWKLPPEEHRALLARHHLVDRPTFNGHGAVYHLKTTAEMLALADKAIAAKGMEYLIIHGLERIEPKWGYQDFWPLAQSVFIPLLDALKERSDRNALWITDHVTWHQYEQERKAATVQVVGATPDRLTLTLTASTDPAFYDLPLTLVTDVPAAWTSCRVVQGTGSAVAVVQDGRIRFDAKPDGTPIVITPAR